jgi:DNA-binding SARP family transcriptional activator/TolB-like protein
MPASQPRNQGSILSPSHNSNVRLCLIGQMEAWTVTGDSILPPGRKTRALLAAICLSSSRPVLRSRLAELLWSRRPDDQARASLRQEIHRLLDALSICQIPVVEVTRDHLMLRDDVAWIDATEVFHATADQPDALSLLDGQLLDGLDGIDPAFDGWLRTERDRLRDHARAIASELLSRQTEPPNILSAAQQVLRIDCTHEGAWRALMRAHAALGERALAIQAYERCRSTLAQMLDAAPSFETAKLLAEIRGHSLDRPATQVAPPLQPAPKRDTKRAGRGGVRIGVIPMLPVGDDAAGRHLAPGLAEEITTALSRFRWMFVVSSSSLARFVMTSRDQSAIGQAFDVDYLLDGTVQREGKRLRINLHLSDLHAGNRIVWARRFDSDASDILDLQDEIAAQVVAQVDPEILLIEARRSASRPKVGASAHDLMLQAIPLIVRLEEGPFMQAGKCLRDAIALQPDFAAAHAWYAYWHVFLVGQGWADDPKATMAAAGKLAERAVLLDPLDARGLAIAGHVRAFLHGRLQEAMALHQRALSLNPNLAMAWALSAVTFAYAGDTDEAERRNDRYKRLSPLDPHAFFFDAFYILIYLLKGDYESAVAIGRTVSEMNTGFSAACKPYLAALGHLGRTREALIVRRRLAAIEPEFSVQKFLATTPLARESDKQRYAEGLRLAGLPERDAMPTSSLGSIHTVVS